MTEPTSDGPTSSFLDSLGARGLRRAEPRTSIVIAGAGCALAILGVLIVSGDTGASDGDFNKWPGVLLCALVVAAGFVVLGAVRQGSLATAGAVAAGLGVPPLMFFLTFDEGGFPPYSTEGILIVSTVAWLASYLIGPGRGRPFFLGAGLIGAWFTLLQLTEEVFDFPFIFVGGFARSFESSFEVEPGGSVGPDDPFGPSAFDAPDPTTMGLLTLALGVLYLVMTRRLDGKGQHGVATPFALATLPTMYVGTVLLADDLEQAGTGLLLMLVGGALAYHGSTVGRRATAWVGGATTAIGAAVFLSDMTDDATIGGMLFLAAGIGLVAAAHAVATALHETDEMELTAVGVHRVPAAVAAPYAPGWTPPPGADEPVPPGRWNPPPGAPAAPPTPPAAPPATPPAGGPPTPSAPPVPPPPAPPSAAPPIPPPPGAPGGEAPPAEPDDEQWAPPADPDDPTSPPAPPS